MKLQVVKTSKKMIQSVQNIDVHIKKNASLTLAGVFLSGWNTRSRMNIFLDGEYARFDCFFSLLGSQKQTFPFDISVIHRKSYSISSIAIRSILFDESKVDSHGLLRVEQHASHTVSSFSHHALLFSDTSSAVILPTLEILADSAQAHHAASVSQLDIDALWYLMSRGISQKNAESLLMQGFFEQDIKKIQDHSLQKKMRKKIHASHALYA